MQGLFGNNHTRFKVFVSIFFKVYITFLKKILEPIFYTSFLGPRTTTLLTLPQIRLYRPHTLPILSEDEKLNLIPVPDRFGYLCLITTVDTFLIKVKVFFGIWRNVVMHYPVKR